MAVIRREWCAPQRWWQPRRTRRNYREFLILPRESIVRMPASAEVGFQASNPQRETLQPHNTQFSAELQGQNGSIVPVACRHDLRNRYSRTWMSEGSSIGVFYLDLREFLFRKHSQRYPEIPGMADTVSAASSDKVSHVPFRSETEECNNARDYSDCCPDGLFHRRQCQRRLVRPVQSQQRRLRRRLCP